MRRKLGIGAVIVSAFVMLAITAASASAVQPTWATCTSVTNGGFKDSHCKTAETGGPFGWKTITANSEPTATPVEAISEGVYKLHSTVGGNEFEIECTKIASTNGKIWNVESTEMGTEGRLELTYTGCAVVKPAARGCLVHSKTGGVATANGTLKTLALKANGSMPSSTINKVTFSPVAGSTEPFINIVVEGCTTTLFNGEKQVKGSAVGESNESTDPGLLSFTTASGSSLTYGGQTATYTGTNRVVMAGTEETIALRTTP